MNKENFRNILARNQELLLSDQYQRLTTPIEMRKGKKDGNLSGDFALLEQQYMSKRDVNIQPNSYMNEGITRLTPSTPSQTQAENIRSGNSKLPQAILESFQKTPVMSGKGSSFPSSQTPSNTAEFFGSNPVQKPVQQESYTPQIQPQNSGNIDYTIVKAIINECIKENLKSIKESILAESSVKGLRFKGNKIQFLDNKGNLYEGTLSLKKRAN